MINLGRLKRNQKSQLAFLAIGVFIAELIVISLVIGDTANDFRYFYVAGKCWLSQKNPYDYAVYLGAFEQFGFLASASPNFSPDPFYYPPQFAPFCLLAALFNWPTANFLFGIFNFLCAIILAVLTTRLATNSEVARPANTLPATRWILPCLVLWMPYVSFQIAIGQSTLMFANCLIGFWYFGRRDKPVIAGILLGLATFKPQFVVLPVFYFLLDRQWKTLVIASVVSILLASYSLLTIGPVVSISGWLHNLSIAGDSRFNSYGSDYVMGLPSTLNALGFATSGPFVFLLGGLVLVFILWLFRKRFCPDDILSIIVLIQLSLVFSHYISTPLLAPVFASVWLHIAHRSKTWFLAALAYICILPTQRLLRPFEIPLLLHSRSILVFLVLVWMIFTSWQQSKSDRRTSVKDC